MALLPFANAPGAAGAGSGTVTNVSSADANATVATPTTTPVITIASAPKWATARNLAGNSVDGSANVAFANKFIVQGTADTGLSAAQFLGALSTGILKVTTTTGVLSTAVAGDFPTLNQNTTGSAASLSAASALPSGTTATTQTTLDNSTKVATTAYADVYARLQIRNTGMGIVSENVQFNLISAGIVLSTTRVYAQLTPFLAGDVVTNIVLQTRTAGVGTTPTSVTAGICDKTGVVKAVTGNFNASTDLTTANKVSVQALTSPFTIPTSDVYYLWIQAVGTWGTTQMSVACTSATQGIVGGAIGSGFATTGTTTLGSAPTTSTTFTLTNPANTAVIWLAAS